MQGAYPLIVKGVTWLGLGYLSYEIYKYSLTFFTNFSGLSNKKKESKSSKLRNSTFSPLWVII